MREPEVDEGSFSSLVSSLADEADIMYIYIYIYIYIYTHSMILLLIALSAHSGGAVAPPHGLGG